MLAFVAACSDAWTNPNLVRAGAYLAGLDVPAGPYDRRAVAGPLRLNRQGLDGAVVRALVIFAARWFGPRWVERRGRHAGDGGDRAPHVPVDGAATPFPLGRLKRSLDISCRKGQDGSRARLSQAAEAGTIHGLINP